MDKHALWAWMDEMQMRKSALAKALGISRPTLDNYLSGRYPVPKLVTLACAALKTAHKPVKR